MIPAQMALEVGGYQTAAVDPQLVETYSCRN